MNADWKVIVGTLAVFVMGLATGVLTLKLGERSARPPFPVMREFGGPQGPGMGHGHEEREEHEGRRWGGGRPWQSPEMLKQMRDYHEKLRAVLDPYQDKIKAVLTADQQQKWEAVRERGFGGQEGPGRMAGGGGLRFVGMIIYKPILERMSRDLQLDAKQQGQLDAIFKDRRAALLAFLDANPPPTIRMALGAGAPPPPTPSPSPAPAPR